MGDSTTNKQPVKTVKKRKKVSKKAPPRKEIDLNLFELDPVDHKLIQMKMEYPKISVRELALHVGFSPSGLNKRMSRPAFKKALADLAQHAQELLADTQTQAMRRLKRLISSKDESIAMQAVRLALTPMLNVSTIDVTTTKEIRYRTQFGEQGQLFQLIEENDRVVPVLELLQ